MKFEEGGTVSGAGQITRADGTVEEFVLTLDPLTKAQADQLNEKHSDVSEEK